MLAGLSHDERGTWIIYYQGLKHRVSEHGFTPTFSFFFIAKLNLEGYNLKNLRYLQQGDTRQDEAEDAVRFQAWKACLGK